MHGPSPDAHPRTQPRAAILDQGRFDPIIRKTAKAAEAMKAMKAAKAAGATSKAMKAMKAMEAQPVKAMKVMKAMKAMKAKAMCPEEKAERMRDQAIHDLIKRARRDAWRELARLGCLAG
jgi:hypothetical protein